MKKSVAVLGCSIALVLATCGSDSPGSGGDSTTPATATTSTAAPAPTSLLPAATTSSSTATSIATTTAAPDVTAPPTNDTSGSTDGGADSTEDTMDSTATDSTGAAGSGSNYVPVASPIVPASTKPVPADNSHPDGVYYASVSEAGDPAPATGSVVFEVVQLFTGPACIAHFSAEDEDACVNDYGVETDPTADVEVALDDQYITVVDAATQQSYQISGDELYALLVGELPSKGAPDDYLYSGFGYLVTYQGGEITRLEQWWTP